MLKFALIATLLIGPEADGTPGPHKGDSYALDTGLTAADCLEELDRLSRLPGSEWIELQPGAVRIEASRNGLGFTCNPEPR